MFHVEQARSWQAPVASPASTFVPGPAASRARASTATRDEALSKVVALEDGSAPPDVPKVDAGGTPSI
jgi:hypothetical protein